MNEQEKKMKELQKEMKSDLRLLEESVKIIRAAFRNEEPSDVEAEANRLTALASMVEENAIKFNELAGELMAEASYEAETLRNKECYF